jgi:hypothetical protein
MVSMTLSIAEDMKHEMDQFPEINWSAIAREAINKRLVMLHKFKEFTKDSDFTEDDAIELGRKVNSAVWKQHKKQHGISN